MSRLWFTSDTHFGHSNIINLEGKGGMARPFASADEMDQAIIDNWNAHVQDGDTVWHLGDFNYRSKKKTEWYLDQLKGHIHIVWGNHDDKFARKIHGRFASAQDAKYMRHEGQKLHMFHYRIMGWRSGNHGAWHLCGHVHGSLNKYKGQWFDGRWLDVGIMNKMWKPDICWLWSFEEVAQYMTTRPSTFHHDGMDGDGEE